MFGSMQIITIFLIILFSLFFGLFTGFSILSIQNKRNEKRYYKRRRVEILGYSPKAREKEEKRREKEERREERKALKEEKKRIREEERKEKEERRRMREEPVFEDLFEEEDISFEEGSSETESIFAEENGSLPDEEEESLIPEEMGDSENKPAKKESFFARIKSLFSAKKENGILDRRICRVSSYSEIMSEGQEESDYVRKRQHTQDEKYRIRRKKES